MSTCTPAGMTIMLGLVDRRDQWRIRTAICKAHLDEFDAAFIDNWLGHLTDNKRALLTAFTMMAPAVYTH